MWAAHQLPQQKTRDQQETLPAAGNSESAWTMGQTLPSWPLHYQFQPLQQCRDKGVSTNKAVTSTLLFCCPNEPRGQEFVQQPSGTFRAVKKQSPSLAHVLVINNPPLYRVPDICQFYWCKICREVWRGNGPTKSWWVPGEKQLREKTCFGKQQVGIKQCCNQDMGIKGISCGEFSWRRCKMSEPKD